VPRTKRGPKRDLSLSEQQTLCALLWELQSKRAFRKYEDTHSLEEKC
jgi:hypothetical protein